MKPRGVLQPTNLGTKNQLPPNGSKNSSNAGSAELENELFEAMQGWDEGEDAGGYGGDHKYRRDHDFEENGDMCLLEGGSTPPVNCSGDEGYEIVQYNKK